MKKANFIILLLFVFSIFNLISADQEHLVIPDTIKAEDYARFISERVDKTAELLVQHERLMPNLSIEEHSIHLDSLKTSFKQFRNDIEALPKFNGSSTFRNSGISTITNVISLLGDDFPQLHEAARQVISSNGDMTNYYKKHDKVAIKLKQIQNTFYQDYEKYLIDNNFYQESIADDQQIDINNLDIFIQDFMDCMNSGDTHLQRFLLPSKLKEYNAVNFELFSYQNFKYSINNIDPKFGMIEVKLILNDAPQSFLIWFKVIAHNDELFIYPAGVNGQKIISWLYISNRDF